MTDLADSARPSRRSAVVAGVITVVLVVVMVNLGFWQLRRHAEVRDQNEQILARSTTPAPIADVDFSAPVDTWNFQLVEVEGRWVPDQEVLWRGRNRNSIPGFEILTPLVVAGDRLDDADDRIGFAYLVDRGFLPDQFDDVPAAVATPPDGPVTVMALARPSVDQPGFGPRDPEEGHLDIVFHADVERIGRQTAVSGIDLAGEVYLRLVSASPATESDVLRPLTPIEPDAGPHLGYALQWFGFSITAVVAYLAWLRKRARSS